MKTIAVLVAMGMEEAQLVQRIENVKPDKQEGKLFLRGKIGQAEVMLHRCGWGMRRAAAGARALIKAAAPDALILYGVSGGLMPNVQLAETVIATSVFSGFGKEDKADTFQPTDEKLCDLAAQCLPSARMAPIATSRGVTSRKKSKARIAAKSGAVCVDMESYSVAKVAREMNVPLLIIRAISDTFEPASLLSFSKNGELAAQKAAENVQTVIQKLAEL